MLNWSFTKQSTLICINLQLISVDKCDINTREWTMTRTACPPLPHPSRRPPSRPRHVGSARKWRSRRHPSSFALDDRLQCDRGLTLLREHDEKVKYCMAAEDKCDTIKRTKWSSYALVQRSGSTSQRAPPIAA